MNLMLKSQLLHVFYMDVEGECLQGRNWELFVKGDEDSPS